MEKNTLIKLAESWEAKAQRAYDAHQETGDRRYGREYEKAQDLADALRIAVNAADDHNLLASLRVDFAYMVHLAEKCQMEGGDEPKDKLVNEALSLGRMYGFISLQGNVAGKEIKK